MSHLEITDARRKRLDELFVDEPFLSPTMKARTLHEKLHEPLPVGFAGRIPLYLYDVDRDEQPGDVIEPTVSPSDPVHTTPETMSLEEARSQLQTESESNQCGALKDLRDCLLNPWLKGMMREFGADEDGLQRLDAVA